MAASKGLLLAGKMINGAAVGGLLSVGTTYASEVRAPPKITYKVKPAVSDFVPRSLHPVSEVSFWGGSPSSASQCNALGLV